MNQMQANANTELAKDYIAKRKIPQLFEALITGLMVHKPEDHIEFIIESLTKYKDGNQQLKWDAFIGRKGGMKNTLAPLKTSANGNDTSAAASSSSHPGLSRPPKLDAISPGKREEKPKIDDQSQSPTHHHHHHHQEQHQNADDRPHSPVRRHHHHEQEENANDRLQSPIDRRHHQEQQHQDPDEPTRHHHHEQEENADDRVQSPVHRDHDQKQHQDVDERPQSPTRHHHQEQRQDADERPQSPTPDQQHRPKVDDHQHETEKETKGKDLLKGKPIIFIGGGPGSGKGTQCEKMIEKYGFTHLSAGDLIRAAAEDSTTEKGRYFNEAMSQGKLVSTEDILGLLKDAIYERAKEASGFLIDGFPRRVDQGIQFEHEVTQCDVLIYFDVPDEVMTERLIKRGETSGRIDDNEETIGKRLVTFHEQTTPILGYYGKQGKLVTIDANRDPDEVFTDVTQALEGLMEQNQQNIPIITK